MKLKTLYLGMLLISPVCLATASPDIKQEKTDLSYIISTYQKQLASHPVNYALLEKKQLSTVSLQRYRLDSQTWTPHGIVTPQDWRHEVDIYIPEAAKEKHALVVINNGINDNTPGKAMPVSNFNQEKLAHIASATQTIVISVSHIPNQPLIYQGNTTPLIEDDSMAYSWNLFMDNPQENQYLPLYIPMSAAVSQTFRLAKQELAVWKIDKFIVTGSSKRGWATWLTALSNPDVDAIVPFAMDLLNIKTSLKHMYRSYGMNWPVAFYPYYKQKIDQRINTKDFVKLTALLDPLSYLNSSLRDRFAIEKYIINASGDDFYIPDNSRFYYDKLPGPKSLRYVPNVTHRDILSVAEQSLISFINRFQKHQKLPVITENIQGEESEKILTVRFSEPPSSITQWTAKNPVVRDFRYACGVQYSPSVMKPVAANTVVKIPLTTPESGWQATYIEVTFNDGYIATSQVYITPDGKYPKTAPPVQEGACKTLPGRG